jgi:hypothetical protein
MNHPLKPQVNEDQEEILFQLRQRVPQDEGYMVDRMIELHDKKHGSAHRVVEGINARADSVGHILRDKDEPLGEAYLQTIYE